jgi:molecular chaperone DnaK
MVGGAHDAASKGLRPEDVSAAVLRQLLANARELHNVHAAVITVPATFTDKQKMATIEAARLADIHVRCSG